MNSSLTMTLEDELASELPGRLAIVGVGDRDHGDDAVGSVVAEMLIRMGVPDVIDSGSAPELDTWRIREIAPDGVLFVDAVDFGGSPGDTALLKPDDLRGGAMDTHRAPLRVTMSYLERELGCKCRLLAVQPGDVRQGAPMCDEVRRSAAILAETLGRKQ